MARLDAWLMIYGKQIFSSFFGNTNLEILRQGRIPFKDMDEALQFQGVLRLATLFEFVKRYELWSTLGSIYMPDVEFGKTDTVCDRFKEIFSAHIFSKQPPYCSSNLSSEQHR